MSIDSFVIFFVTTMVIVLSPGPAVLVVVSTAVSTTLKHAAWIIVGIALADMSYFVLSAMGTVTVILASPVLFSVIKWAGVVYLIYLGIQALFNTRSEGQVHISQKGNKGFVATVLKGYFLEISNPKALLYFSALLPQFVDITQPLALQLILLGAAVCILDICCYSLYAYLGSATSAIQFSSRTKTILKKMAGGFLVMAGIKMATFAQ